MTKKKHVDTFKPFTEEEWATFVVLWEKAKETASRYERIARLAYEKAKLYDYRNATGVSFIEGFDYVNKDGMQGFEMQEDTYDAGHYSRAYVSIPLGYILNPAPYNEQADKDWAAHANEEIKKERRMGTPKL